MKRLTRAEAHDQFGLMDAEFVRCDCLPGKAEAEYVVRYYPYWEHPTYLHPMEMGKQWLVPGREEAAQEVRVVLHHVKEVRLSERRRVEEWSFPESHPVLFAHQGQVQIVCTTELNPKALRKLLRNEWFDILGDGELMRVCGLGRDPTEPFQLGTFASPLAHSIEAALRELDVQFKSSPTPPPATVPEMFLIDSKDYVLCDRIEVELPEFKHHPSWVTLDS